MAASLVTLVAQDLRGKHQTNNGLLFGPISFTCTAGQLVALVGRNGGGKTTLMRSLAGEPSLPVSGTWLWQQNGSSITPSMAWLPQQQVVPYELTVLQLVVAGRYSHKSFWQSYSAADYELAMAALERLGVAHLSGRMFHTLSGGEQQLAWLAQAEVQDADVLMLDEPLHYLDLYHKSLVMNWLVQQKLKGKLVLFSTHDLDVMQQHPPDIILLLSGEDCKSMPIINHQELLESLGVVRTVLTTAPKR